MEWSTLKMVKKSLPYVRYPDRVSQCKIDNTVFVLEVVPRQLRVGPFLTDVYS